MMDKSEWSNEKKAFLGTEEKRQQARAALRAIRDMGDDTPEPLRVQMRLEECHKGLCRAEGERDQARAERDRLRGQLQAVLSQLTVWMRANTVDTPHEIAIILEEHRDDLYV